MSVIAYKFQAPDGSYWYIKADDQRTLEYWRDKRKMIPLTDDKARIAAGVVVEESWNLEVEKAAAALAIELAEARHMLNKLRNPHPRLRVEYWTGRWWEPLQGAKLDETLDALEPAPQWTVPFEA